MKRFGIYFTPAEDSGLTQAAKQWLGRDIWSPACCNTPFAPGIPESRIFELLQSPRHYGFHATLKPPFRLAGNYREEQILQRLDLFARKCRSFTLPALQVEVMSGFFCLRPQSDCRELFLLAAEVVQQFDDLRLPPTREELTRRRAAGLSPNQEKMLQTWGYPFVMSEFRFHLTLTAKTAGKDEQEKLWPILHDYFPEKILRDVQLDNLALFVEEDAAPMYCLGTISLPR